MPQAKIITTSEIVTYPTPGKPKIVVAVTYQIDTQPPRTVWIDKEKLTDEAIRQAIRADQEALAKETPRVISL